MPPRRSSPDSPAEWLNRARGSLAIAKGGLQIPGVYLEDLCFDAQQAAEKAIKAVLIHIRVPFPYVHDLADLLTLVDSNGEPVPDDVRQAARLSGYAVESRYPGVSEPVDEKEYREAIALAGVVLAWAKDIIST